MARLAPMTDDALIAAAREAAGSSYSPYSDYPVGAALLFVDGEVVTGTNIENASFGLALCAETVAVARAMADGRRGGLVRVAIAGPIDRGSGDPVTPCGRCRQVLHELAQLGGTDPEVLCAGSSEIKTVRLSALLPNAFGSSALS